MPILIPAASQQLGMPKKDDAPPPVDPNKRVYEAKLFLHSTWAPDQRDQALLTNASSGKYDRVKRGITEDKADVNARITWRDGYTSLLYAVQENDNNVSYCSKVKCALFSSVTIVSYE